MTEPTKKALLLAEIEDAHTKFKALLAPLSEQQLTTPGVNGTWSVKDNVAHISVWQKVLLARLLAAGNVIFHEELTDQTDVDTLNERFFQANKARPLAEILDELDAIHQRVTQEIEHLSEEQLNRPQAWLAEKPVWDYIAGDTTEHYEEHSEIINRWLHAEIHKGFGDYSS